MPFQSILLGVAACLLCIRCADGRVLLTVIVSRHGIRTPFPPDLVGNLTKESLRKYTSQDFPACYPPGPETSDIWGTSDTTGLTPHGAKNLKNMGQHMGQQNFSGIPCRNVALYADFDSSRDNLTAKSWSSGAFPDCSDLPLHGHGIYKQLFNGGQDQSLCKAPDRAVVDALLGGPELNYSALRSAYAQQIQTVDDVIQCCSKEACGFEPCNLKVLPIESSGAFFPPTRGAFYQAFYWGEFFLMEAINGHKQFALGKLSLQEAVDGYRVNVEGLEQISNHFTGPAFASTMMAFILASLKQASDGKQIKGLQHGPEAQVVYLAGHDVNLILLRKLLDLTWVTQGWFPNAVPPGSMLIFELRQEEDGDVFIDTYAQAALPEQLRTADDLTAAPPGRSRVAIPGCGEPCRLADFEKTILSRIRRSCIGMPEMQQFVADLLPHGGDEPGNSREIGVPLLLGMSVLCLVLGLVIGAAFHRYLRCCQRVCGGSRSEPLLQGSVEVGEQLSDRQ